MIIEQDLEHGIETLRVYRRGPWVYKVRTSNLDIIPLHNRFFGDLTPYSIVKRQQDGVLIRQPYIQLVPNSSQCARERLFEEFWEKFGDAIRTDYEIWAAGYLFDDLKDVNIVTALKC